MQCQVGEWPQYYTSMSVKIWFVIVTSQKVRLLALVKTEEWKTFKISSGKSDDFDIYDLWRLKIFS